MMKLHWPLYFNIIFFVDYYSAGVANKHCLLPLSIGIVSLRNMPMHYAMVFKSNRKEMNRNWSNQKANPALKTTKTGNK